VFVFFLKDIALLIFRFACSKPFEQLFQLHIERQRQSVQSINSGGYGSILNLAEVCPSNSSHIGKLSLRQAVLFPYFAQTAAKADGKRDCHFPIVTAIVNKNVR
jgi:hypothetical protein